MKRLIAIFAAQIRNTINTLKRTFKEFYHTHTHQKSYMYLLPWQKPWDRAERAGLRGRSNTQVSTLEMQYPMLHISNASLHVTSVVILVTHAFKDMHRQQKLQKNLNAWHATLHFMLQETCLSWKRNQYIYIYSVFRDLNHMHPGNSHSNDKDVLC